MYMDLEMEIDGVVERELEEERERRFLDTSDENLTKGEQVYLLCDPDVEYCACEGTGWVPFNNDEDEKCLYHGPFPGQLP